MRDARMRRLLDDSGQLDGKKERIKEKRREMESGEVDKRPAKMPRRAASLDPLRHPVIVTWGLFKGGYQLKHCDIQQERKATFGLD